MKVLWLLTRELDAAGEAIAREQAALAAVETVDLRTETDFGKVVDAVAAADRVVTW